MKNNIERSIARAIEQAPIDLLDKLKSQPVKKMDDHDYITRQEEPNTRKRWYIPGFAFAAIIIGFFVLNILPIYSIEGTIYIDLNPSIEINYNNKEKVISIDGIGAKDKDLIKGIDFKGKDIYRLTEEIIHLLPKIKEPDLLQPALLVSVENKNNEKGQFQRERLESLIKEQLKRENIKQVVLSQNITSSHTLEDFSQRYKVSLGKMIFMRNLIILDPSLTIEDLAELTIDQLVRLSLDTGLNLNTIINVEENIKSLYEETPETIPPPSGSTNPPSQTEQPPTTSAEKPAKKMLTKEQAKNIGLKLVKGTIKDIDIDLEKEDGILVYEVEIETEDKEYEIIIDAYSGEILEVEVEKD